MRMPTDSAEGRWRELLSIARWTPSPHNTQPWRVRILDASRARVLLDHRRALPKEDLTGCFIYCAMGSFLESLRLLAANRGLRLVVTPLQEERHDHLEPFADVSLIRDDSVTPEIEDELFLRRQTSRLTPSNELLTSDELHAFTRVVQHFGQSILHFSDRHVIDQLMQLNLEAVVHDLNSKAYHDEIVSWFRYRERDAVQRSDGLSAVCMAIPPLEFFLFARFPWCTKVPVLGALARRQYQRRLGPVPQLAALSGPFWDRAAATNAGAAMMRLWLEMTRFGLYIHPFGNLVTNDTARDAMNALTGDDNIWIVFRIGRTAPPPRSHRLAVEDIIDA